MKTYNDLLIDLLSGKFSFVGGRGYYTHDGYKYQCVIDVGHLTFHVWKAVTEYVYHGTLR